MSSVEGPLQQRARQRDAAGLVSQYTFVYTVEEMAIWLDWWRNTLLRGQRWFAIALPGAGGMVARVARYLRVQQQQLGMGLYRVTASFEQRGASLPPSSEAEANLNVVLHLHGDGEPSTDIIDSSPYARNPSAIGSAALQVVSDASAFGGSALLAQQGLVDYVRYDGEFADEEEDLSAEYWMRFVSMTGQGDGFAEGRGEFLRIASGGSVRHSANGTINSPSTLTFTTPFAVAVNWSSYGLAAVTDRVHVAWIRRGSTGIAQLFFNGWYVEEGIAPGVIDRVYVGNTGSSRSTTAYIDELYIERGVRRYDRGSAPSGSLVFTPPTGPF